MATIDTSLHQLAETQHGLVARRQADALGLGRRSWLRRLEKDGWEPLSDRVARRTGSPPTAAQRALAGVLDAGPSTYLSEDSAATMWDVPGFCLDPIEVMSTRGRAVRSSLATVHLPRHLPDPFAATLDGVPVVRPALLLLQLSARVHPARLARILDHLWSRRLLSGPSVRAELAPVMHRGRPGTANLRRLLDSLPDDYVPTASALESRFASIISLHDLPRMRRQVDLGDDVRWCGRVDFLAEEFPLVVEVQSDRFHTALGDAASDLERRRRLEAAGFVVVEVDELDIWHRPNVVVDRVRKAWWRLQAARTNHRPRSEVRRAS